MSAQQLYQITLTAGELRIITGSLALVVDALRVQQLEAALNGHDAHDALLQRLVPLLEQ